MADIGETAQRRERDLAVDHLIHVVGDPQATRYLFERELGVRTIPGGDHPAWGTWNALAYFGLSYIEWLGVKDAATAASAAFGQSALQRLAMGEGAGQFALRTHTMDALARGWRERGLTFVGPMEGSRTRPDGRIIRWRLLFPEQAEWCDAGHSQAPLPFVIEWADSDDVRIADLQTSGALPEQQEFRLAALHVMTADPLAWIRRFNTYFADAVPDGGAPGAAAGEHGASPPPAAPCQMDIGGTMLYVWSKADAVAHGANTRVLAAPGPFCVELCCCGACVDRPNDAAPEITVLAGLQVRMSG